MCSFHSFIEELYDNTKIPFNIQLDGETEVVLASVEDSTDEMVNIPIDIGHKKGKIVTHKNYESCTNLLKYFIESKLKEIYMSKEEIVISVLEGGSINIETIKDNIPLLLKEYYLITIFLENSYSEGLELIQEGYSDDEVICLEYNKHLVMIGSLEDIEEHVNSLKESISSNLYSKCYISYCKVKDIDELKTCYEDNISKIELAIKYNLSERIYGERSLLFESIVDSIDKDAKNKIFKDFNDGFSKLDGEMTKTIEVFFECGLNISDASKELYVHRNTLIYRLDKIQKFTTYDIRNFNEAVIFKIAFLTWKENQK